MSEPYGVLSLFTWTKAGFSRYYKLKFYRRIFCDFSALMAVHKSLIAELRYFCTSLPSHHFVINTKNFSIVLVHVRACNVINFPVICVRMVRKLVLLILT